MNADDRVPVDPLGRVEGGNRIVEGSHVADVRPQPTIPDPLDELDERYRIARDHPVQRRTLSSFCVDTCSSRWPNSRSQNVSAVVS